MVYLNHEYQQLVNKKKSPTMIIIGITDSIGMGKTTISSMLKFLNIPIFDSDKEVKIILEENKRVIDKIQKLWPDVVSFKDKQKIINKFYLSDRIFSDKKNKKLLEDLIHPIVKDKRKQFIHKFNQSKIIGLDVPLLYETKTNKICNFIFLVNTSKEIQQKRVLNRPKMTKEKFNLINDAQWDYERKKKYKPFIIDTSFGKIISFIQVMIYLVIIFIKQKGKHE